MSIRSILVPLEGSEDGASVLETALQAAHTFGAHLEVLHVRADVNEIFSFMTEPASATAVELVLEAAEKGSAELAAKARGLFEAFCKSNDVTISHSAPSGGGTFAVWFEVTGRQGDVIARRGRLADLIVVARPFKDAPSPVILETALLETGRPVLAAPPTAAAALGTKIAVAWNGTAQSSHAVDAALPWLEAAGTVTVITAEEKGKFVASAAELSTYLAWHGISASTETVNPGDGDAGEAILAAAAKAGADLLVMGGYGHSRVREVILGGVTHHVLGAAEIPVFMAH